MNTPFVAWDIETVTSGGHGLDPNEGGILSIAAAAYSDCEPDSPPTSTFYASVLESVPAELRPRTFADPSEEAVLFAFNRWLGRATPDWIAGPLVGWNSSCFDAPFAFRRAELLRVRIDLSLSFAPDIVSKYPPLPGFHGGYEHNWTPEWFGVDLAYSAYSRGNCEHWGVRHRLKDGAEHFGITDGVRVDASKVSDLSGDDLRAYNLSDVRLTAELYKRHVREVEASRAR